MTLREDIIKSLKEKSPNDFLSDYIYDHIPFVFGLDRGKYVSWKQKLGGLIGVDAYSILFVGSAAIGVSLNPVKNLRPFDENSDIDVAIISNHYFTLAWRYLRNNGHIRLRLDPKLLTAWDEHVSRLIFYGTIATDKILALLPFGNEWLKALNEMSKVDPTFGRQINFRIYNDYESLRGYQLLSAKNTREILLLESGGNAKIS